MDGLLPPPQPSQNNGNVNTGLPAFVPPGAPPPPGMLQPRQAATGPVGRPSGDPDKQAEREENTRARARLKSILPAAMTDGSLAIYRLRGRYGKNKKIERPVLTILYKDLEEFKKDNPGIDPADWIKDQIEERFGAEGRYLVTPRDQNGRSVPGFGEFEINFEDVDPLNDDEVEDTSVRITAPGAGSVPPPPPGSPPPFDPGVFVQETRRAMAATSEQGNNMFGMLMQVMIQNNEQARIEADRRRQEEERRAEREREREEQRREREERRREAEEQRRREEEKAEREREREERKQEHERQMQAHQAQMQFFMKMMEPKPDIVTPLLFKMIEGKNDRDGMKELMTVMGESSKQAMGLQGEAAKHMMAAQAESAKMLIANVMGISKTMVEQMVEAQSAPGDSDDPMDKVTRIFKMIAPAIQAFGQKPPEIPQVPSQVALPAPAAAPQPAAQPAQPQRPATPEELTRGCLHTVRRLETGELSAEQRLPALQWVGEHLPPEMAVAVRAGNKEKIMELGTAALDDVLLPWLGGEGHAEFLERALTDVQKMLLGGFTQEDAKASIQAHLEYQRAKGGETRPQPQAPTEERRGGKRPPPPVELATPLDDEDKDEGAAAGAKV